MTQVALAHSLNLSLSYVNKYADKESLERAYKIIYDSGLTSREKKIKLYQIKNVREEQVDKIWIAYMKRLGRV